ncbi:glycosyl hydrolase family 85-domain-containing protein [Amylocystis lapponica]|nr:glycosyl hydrolase family 85-domain-containing protein [Amylocystis lapponica]
MPLRGSAHSPRSSDDAPYFRTLADLDEWASTPSAKLNGVLEYRARSPMAAEGLPSDNRGKLLVCHDYKGGYTESPSGLAYTFNFWSYCDTFIYFSHHRVTVPPSGWTTAAHRHGVKMLGTLIFEGEGQQDCLRLLVGCLPRSKTGPALPSTTTALPLSPHYARLLAELAYQRGFDGYLLNFECPLLGGLEQTRALAAWISLLESELKRKIGMHAEVIWYDSVVITGQLRWQDRLNNHNLPFFLPSTGFFTNYTWPPHYPSRTAEYFLSLDSALMSQQPKQLRDIFVGVDVWGRGSHGGGGLGCYRAITHIDPEILGLSVALFGQAWTWETEQDKPGFTWETWWAYERTLWVGPPTAGEAVEVPPPPQRDGEPECPHGAFVPLSSFFPRRPPPNPLVLPFFTTFSPGIGRAWFVGGVKVLQTDAGWTDVDKISSLGDLVWPRPTPQWEDDTRTDQLPEASTALSLDDAWLGGSCLCLSLAMPGSDAEDAFFRCLWLPVQSLGITQNISYDMFVVYKVASDKPVDFDLGLSVKSLASPATDEFTVTPLSSEDSGDLAGGWSKLVIQFILPSSRPTDILSAVGLIVGLASEDPTEPLNVSITIGALSVYPSLPSPGLSVHQPRILWVDFRQDSSLPQPSPFAGTLTWDVAASFAPLTNGTIPSVEDPQPIWTLDPSFPTFSYFNIYVQAHEPDGVVPPPDSASFIGTTGLRGEENSFYVDPACLPPGLAVARSVHFYVQGVTARGHVLNWESCAFVAVRAPQ